MNAANVWFVTGASQGLGLLLTQKLIQEGYRVAATSRKLDTLVKEIGPASDQFLPVQVSLTEPSSVQQAVAQTITTFGRIDVVVNNAGYGQFGTLEELSDEEARKNFDINVFGSLNVIREVMPHLRNQQSGHIFNIASIGGYTANFAGWGIYCATKFAVAGFTESLAAEAKSFGIHATVVYPGYFRTNFLTQESMATPARRIEAYAEAQASLSAHREDINGNQPGDPAKAVAALITVATTPTPPLHLFLGSDAYGMMQEKMAAVQADVEAWKDLTLSTDFTSES